MARYEITAPDGKRFEITAPDGATQDEVMAYAKSQFNAQESTQQTGSYAKSMAEVPITGFDGDMIPATPAEPYKEPQRVIQPTGIDAAIGSTPVIGGAYEYAKSITPQPVRNFLSSAVSGGADVVQTGAAMLSGISSDVLGRVTAIPHAFYGDKNPDEVYQRVAEANQYVPTRQGARQNLQAIGELMQPLESLPPVIGAGMPQMNAIARSAAMRPELPQDVTPSKGMQEALDINRGSQSSGYATKTTTAQEPMKVIVDKKGVEAVRQGFEPKLVQMIKQVSPSDKKKFQQMLDVTEKSQDELLYSAYNRPSDIAGDSLKQRILLVKDANKKAGSEVDAAAQKLKGESVDYSGSVQSFLDDLDSVGVRLDKNNQPIFKGSDLEGFGADEKIIRQVIGRMRETKVPTAYDVHRMKRYIDNNVTYGKSTEGGITPQTISALKKLRASLDADLDGKFPEYDKANTKYSKTIKAIGNMQDSAGTIDLFGEGSEKALGTRLRALLSNQQKRQDMANAIDELDSVAKEFGGKFDDNIGAQIMFADAVERAFKVGAKTSLRGEASQAVQDASGVALGQKTMSGVAMEKAANLVEKARGVNEKNALKSLRELVKE